MPGPVFGPPEDALRDRSLALGPFQIGELQDLVDALSLACNCPMVAVHQWARIDDAVVTLTGYGWGGVGDGSSARHHARETLTQDKASLAMDLLPKLSQKQGELHRAITKWRNSHTTGGIDNKLIELRILLEMLYAKKDSGEISYRVALHGAWHAGDKDMFNVLKKTYSDASRVIHGGRTPTRRD